MLDLIVSNLSRTMQYMSHAQFVRRLAVDSSTDPRTVRKYLAGKQVAPMPHERITYALVDRGLTSHVRAPIAVDYSPRSKA